LYVDVASHGVTIYGLDYDSETAYFPLPAGIFDGLFADSGDGALGATGSAVEDMIASLNLRLPKVGTTVLVANMGKTAVRIADLSGITKPTKKNFPEAKQWNLVAANFPIGKKMNENTHNFDGNIFANNNGQARFFMTALPVAVSDIIAKIGIALTGSIHRVDRLDTAEHILFRRYAAKADATESLLITLPQDDGLRLLHIAENLPNAAHYISNHPTHREDEFLRFLNTINSTSKKDNNSKTAILLNNKHTLQDWQWLHAILSVNDFDVTEEGYVK